MRKKKLLTFVVVMSMLAMWAPATIVAASNPVVPTINISTSNITSNSATVNVNISLGTGNTAIQNGMVLFFSTNSNVFSSNDQRIITTTGASSFTFPGLEPNRTYHVGVRINYTDANDVSGFTNFTHSFSTTGASTTTAGRPAVSTRNVTNITRDRADVGITVSSQGNSNVRERGVVYSSTNSTPTIDDEYKTVSGSGTGNATVSLTGLSRDTRYYVRAYAINNQGISYADEIRDFRTLLTSSGSGDAPDAVTVRVEDVTAYTAEIMINIRSGINITERGVVYSSTNESPERTGSRNHTQRIHGTTGEMVVMLQDLAKNTIYYARAYATNNHGTSYGDIVEFTTESEDDIPHVVTVSANATSNEAMEVRIDVKRDNGSSITERGVVYSISEINPKLGDRNTYEEEVSGRTGATTVELTKLSRDETYYVRAFATNRYGTAYGAVIEVRLGGSNYVVTNKILNITGTTATASGVATYSSDLEIKETGVVYSTENKFPTISDTVTRADDVDHGDFTVDLTGLTPNETYYLRAFIRTSAGYEYGNVEEFTTTGNATLNIQYRLPDGNQVGAQTLTFAPGRVITRENLSPPQGFSLLHPDQTYTMPSTNDTITVYVRFGSVYQPLQPNRAAGTQVMARSSSNTLILSGQSTDFPAVNIDDFNWLKLRDIAMLLRGTNKQFEVGFDAARNTASITSNMPYTPAGGELLNTLSPNQIAVATPQRLVMNGNEISVAAYNIGGFNYFRLRDIAILLDFGLGFNAASGVITLQLDSPYSE